VRWFWFDRFEQFEPRRRAVTTKCVSLAEEHLHDHFHGFPTMPASLMIEGMAQTAGTLVGEARDFREKVVLAKVKRAVFQRIVRPGEQIRYVAEMEQLADSAASTIGKVYIGSELVAEVDLVFSYIDNNLSGIEFPEENFVFTEDFLAALQAFRHQAAERIPL
jgi:3-hydroxyacyl-[acyl-carrier-protein] dehydratase